MLTKLEINNGVALIQLLRPNALNAINEEMLYEIISNAQEADRNKDVGCIVFTGSGKAFSAGADIRELMAKDFREMLDEDFFSVWEDFTKIRTPKIAAVNGYALGGGLELALMCDIIFASSNAVFGLPELNLGVIPGIGGTQRLPRLVGKAMAMDMILTGRTLSAGEALQYGLASRVFGESDLMEESLSAARKIAGYSRPAVLLARESINRTWETNLKEGLLVERRNYHVTFATGESTEGMSAFLEKREPDFRRAMHGCKTRSLSQHNFDKKIKTLQYKRIPIPKRDGVVVKSV